MDSLLLALELAAFPVSLRTCFRKDISSEKQWGVPVKIKKFWQMFTAVKYNFQAYLASLSTWWLVTIASINISLERMDYVTFLVNTTERSVFFDCSTFTCLLLWCDGWLDGINELRENKGSWSNDDDDDDDDDDRGGYDTNDGNDNSKDNDNNEDENDTKIMMMTITITMMITMMITMAMMMLVVMVIIMLKKLMTTMMTTIMLILSWFLFAPSTLRRHLHVILSDDQKIKSIIQSNATQGVHQKFQPSGRFPCMSRYETYFFQTQLLTRPSCSS